MKAARMNRTTLPVGLISENNDFAYGYDGDKCYVTECSLLDYFVTKTALLFDEAKALFEALSFIGDPAPKPTEITKLVKAARKQKLINDDLFWYFVDGLSK